MHESFTSTSLDWSSNDIRILLEAEKIEVAYINLIGKCQVRINCFTKQEKKIGDFIKICMTVFGKLIGILKKYTLDFVTL